MFDAMTVVVEPACEMHVYALNIFIKYLNSEVLKVSEYTQTEFSVKR